MNDYIDLSDLQKRGILQRAKEITDKKDSSGVIDFTRLQEPSESSGASNNGASNPLAGFFGSVDSGSASQNSSDVHDSSGSYRDSSSSNSDAELNALKIKLEDTEYKLDRALERLNEIESKLADFKNKVS